MYSGPITISERHGYRLDSYGNGAAYTLTRLSDGASVFFQGDDADQFRADYRAADECAFTDRAERDLFQAYGDVMTLPA